LLGFFLLLVSNHQRIAFNVVGCKYTNYRIKFDELSFVAQEKRKYGSKLLFFEPK
jgi:hypothetical protein